MRAGSLSQAPRPADEPDMTEPSPSLTPHDAHRFLPEEEDGEHCVICGEKRIHIRHHPTRVRAALLVRGLDPDAAA